MSEEIGTHRRAAMAKIEAEKATDRGEGGKFSTKPGHLRRVEIARQVEALTARLILRVQGLDVKLTDGGTSEMVRLSEMLAKMLFSTAQQAREVAARKIADNLLDVGEKTDPAFWSTDLGRAIAREIGWVAILPNRQIARNVLNVSRQAIDQMVQRGDLDAGSGQEGPCVTRDSLRRAALRRWPIGADIY